MSTKHAHPATIYGYCPECASSKVEMAVLHNGGGPYYQCNSCGTFLYAIQIERAAVRYGASDYSVRAALADAKGA